MGIVQSYICDSCGEKWSDSRERLKISITGIPEKQSINAVKDTCSYICALRIINELVSLPSTVPAVVDIFIDELDFSVRVCNWLENNNIKTVNELCLFHWWKLPRLKQPNKRMMNEMITELEKLNRRLSAAT